ncbi:hypothetical protein ID866_10647, partial [Astraeus odoratus]
MSWLLELLLPTTLLAFIQLPFNYVQRQLSYLLLSVIASGPVPRHIAFEMDGNRRYARRLGKAGKEGHGDGFRALLRVLEYCLHLRVHCVTVYAFAIDNFNRPKDEVDALMKLAEERLVEIASKGHILDQYGVRLNVLGRRSLLPRNVQLAIEKAEGMTRHNKTAILNVCAPYASSHEITAAVESAIRHALAMGDLDGRCVLGSTNFVCCQNLPRGTPPGLLFDPMWYIGLVYSLSSPLHSTITEETIEAQLSTTLAGSPPLDVFVRTSGVKRLSGFLTWQVNELFTEIDIPPSDTNRETLSHIITRYIGHCAVGDKAAIMNVTEFYVAVRTLTEERQLAD